MIHSKTLKLPQLKLNYTNGESKNVSGMPIPYRLTSSGTLNQAAIHVLDMGELTLVKSNELKSFEAQVNDSTSLLFHIFKYKDSKLFGVAFKMGDKKYVASNDYSGRTECFSNRNNKCYKKFKYYAVSSKGKLRALKSSSYIYGLVKEEFKKLRVQ